MAKEIVCMWKITNDPGGDVYYETSCGQEYMLKGSTTDNFMIYLFYILYNFCPYCGGKLIEGELK